MQTHFFHLGYKSWKWLPGVRRHNRPCLLYKVTTRVKVKPAIFGLGAHAPGASLAVSGLQKPPAGSGRGGGGGGGNGPAWKETVDMGRGQLLSHGRLSNPGGAPPPGWAHEPQRAFGTHGCKERHFPPRPSTFHQHPCAQWILDCI